MSKKNPNKESGQLIIIALVFMTVAIFLVGSLVTYTLIQVRSHRQAVAREQGISIAEAGIESAIWKLNHQSGYTGESDTAYGAGTYSISITNLSGSSKLIKADSYVPNRTNARAHRIIQVTATIGTKNIGFNYGVQVGDGGLVMDNNAIINGNVYSDGNITGANGATISGDTIVAGSSGTISDMNVTGSVTAHTISNVDVGANANATNINNGTTVAGNASADALSNCTISGDATYNTRSSCNVSGTTTTPNPSVPADPANVPLPIDDTQITEWENQATSGGVIASQTINGTTSLGPIKINGNLTVNGTLNLTGTVWVTGSISITNLSTVKLDPSFGNLSGVLMAGTNGSSTDGSINISNNATLTGSGTAGSYLLVLSEMNSATTKAIDVANNSNAAVYYAGQGLVEVLNNAFAKELTGYKMHMNNNAVITYDSGLASAAFTTGPSQGWQMLAQSWQLLQ